MKLWEKREKVIVFRVGKEQYKILKQLAKEKANGNLSVLWREIVQSYIDSNHTGN
jgi:hypothetical protein